MKIQAIVAFGPIITEINKSREFYVKTLSLELKEEANNYFHTETLDGVKHFTLMPLTLAAQICFNTNTWPENEQKPTAWIEYQVEDIGTATKELQEAKYKLFIANQEAWGQKTTWLLSPEGILTKISSLPNAA